MGKAAIIDGKALAARIRGDVREIVSGMPHKPGLAVILVGNDPASAVYVGNKIKACEDVGVRSFEYRLPEDVNPAEVMLLIDRLNRDPDVHGILLQLPLPAHLDSETLIQTIDPGKDVDGLTVLSAGKLFCGVEGLVPCTPQGSLALLKETLGETGLSGKHAVVIGRSQLFGKPMGQLLLAADCTVTQAHSKTRDLASLCRLADILVVAVGRPGLVRGDWIKPGATVIDVGINRDSESGQLVGDVAFDEAVTVAGAITPVPGGVGPMTIACLLSNTLKAARHVVRRG